MKDKKYYWKDIGLGIVKFVGGVVLATGIPTTFGVSLYESKTNAKNYDNYLSEVQATADFQEASQSELEKLETQYNNSEIQINEYQTNKDYVQSEEFVVNYAKDNYPDIYQGIIKSKSAYENWEGCVNIFGALSLVEAVTTLYGATQVWPEGLNLLISSAIDDFKYAKVPEDINKKTLKGADENIPEVNLE